MPSADERPIDESQDLNEGTDDRDRGYGIVVDDGEIVQLEPEENDDPEED
jgi:hypothetical protein